MDTTDSLGHGVGGGEILSYWGNQEAYRPDSPWLNNDLIRQYHLVPIVEFIVFALIIFIMVKLIMRMFQIYSFKRSRGVTNELNYMEKVRKSDAKILRQNKLIAKLTMIVEATPFKVNKSEVEYLDYNLRRANVRIPGGSRVYKAAEFNAMVVFITACICAVWMFIIIFANYILGSVLIVFTILMASVMPMMILRQTVKAKDEEIKSNFSDFYLMLHYTLLAGAKAPLSGIMKSYAKTTDSKEMLQVVDTCVHYFDTYGEFEGTRYIASAYREIPVMGKLMRLIRQSQSGGNIEAELMGFRAELLREKRYAIQKRTDKLINRARASFNLLMPILFQAILSAMSIYFSDLGMISTFV